MVLEDNHYIFRLRESCLAQPEWNRHQIAALDHEIALASKASSISEYLAKSLDILELARAGALDRAFNLAQIADRYDDPWLASGARIEYLHAAEGEDHVALQAAILNGQAAATLLRQQSTAVSTSIDRLFAGLLKFHTSHLDADALLLEIKVCIETLMRLDPEFFDHPRYRRRLPWPWDTPRQWLSGLRASDAEELPSLPASHLLEVNFAHSRWLDRLSARISFSPVCSPLALAKSPSFADIYLERQSVWPDPDLARLAQEAKIAIDSASTPIAREAITEDCRTRFQIESTRNSLLLSSLIAPLRAIATHGWMRDDQSQAAISKASHTVFALTGYRPEEIAQLPRVKHHLEHNLWPRLEMDNEGLGAMQGEAGFDLLQHALAWQEVGGRVAFFA